MYVDDSSTFVRNGGYHFDKEVELSGLASIIGSESGRRIVFERRPTVTLPHVATAINGDVPHHTELPPAGLTPSKAFPPACARR